MQLNFENKTNFAILDELIFTGIADNVLKLKKQPTEVIALSLTIVNKEEIQEINREYRGKDKPTDVISFRLMETESGKTINQENFPFDFDPSMGFYIGEIFICLEVAKLQAIELEHSLEREIAELFVHGLLHVLGHDHETLPEAQKMKELEEAMEPYLDEIIPE